MNAIDTIKKLLAMAESANENEAAVAAEKAAMLAMKHGLDLDNLRKTETKPQVELKESEWRQAKLEAWEIAIAEAVAYSNSIGFVIITRGSRKIGGRFVGADFHVSVAKQMYIYLTGSIKALNRIEASKRNMSRAERAKFRTAFRYGASIRLGMRLRDRAQAMRQEDSVAQEATGRNALVVQDYHTRMMAMAHEAMTGLDTVTVAAPNINHDEGLQAGRRAGERISLDPAMQGGDGDDSSKTSLPGV